MLYCISFAKMGETAFPCESKLRQGLGMISSTSSGVSAREDCKCQKEPSSGLATKKGMASFLGKMATTSSFTSQPSLRMDSNH